MQWGGIVGVVILIFVAVILFVCAIRSYVRSRAGAHTNIESTDVTFLTDSNIFTEPLMPFRKWYPINFNFNNAATLSFFIGGPNWVKKSDNPADCATTKATDHKDEVTEGMDFTGKDISLFFYENDVTFNNIHLTFHHKFFECDICKIGPIHFTCDTCKGKNNFGAIWCENVTCSSCGEDTFIFTSLKDERSQKVVMGILYYSAIVLRSADPSWLVEISDQYAKRKLYHISDFQKMQMYINGAIENLHRRGRWSTDLPLPVPRVGINTPRQIDDSTRRLLGSTNIVREAFPSLKEKKLPKWSTTDLPVTFPDPKLPGYDSLIDKQATHYVVTKKKMSKNEMLADPEYQKLATISSKGVRDEDARTKVRILKEKVIDDLNRATERKSQPP